MSFSEAPPHVLEICNWYDLSLIPKLKCLSFNVVLIINDNYEPKPFQEFCTFLSNIPRNNHNIEKLGLHLRTDSHRDLLPWSHLELADWQTLDSTLTEISNGRPLEVTIHLHYEFVWASDVLRTLDEDELNEEAPGWIAEQLPITASQPQIQLQLHPSWIITPDSP